MFTLTVLSGVTPVYRPGIKPILIDPKDFTPTWCHHNLAGRLFDSVYIWESHDPQATAYALTRVRVEPFCIVLTKSVWESLEGFYKVDGISEEELQEFKKSLVIVEDLNGSN